MLDLRATLDVTIPVIKKLPECADFSITVQPYLPQLYDLPQKIFEHINNLEALQHIYVSTNPAITALALALFLTPVVLILSEVNKNYSQVDRLWSILPVIYNCHYSLWAHLSGLPTEKVDHVMAVTVLWGLRLTFNYWRRGGYSIGSQDYRWPIVKEYAGSFLMFLFNVVFISLVQNLLLFGITAPTYILLLSSRISGPQLSQYDQIFPKLMFFLIIIEFYADQQQWKYHQAKHEYQRTAKVPRGCQYTREQLDRGFNTSGLWAWSRHPNFAAEQAFWVLLYQWSCCESLTYMNWTFSAAISYLLLFQASTWLTELLSAKKYPEYRIYQEKVGKFLPSGNTKSMDTPNLPPKTKEAELKEAKETKGSGKTKRR